MDEILFEYMSDAEKRLESFGEITNPAFSDGEGYTNDGILSPKIFGEKGKASCQCGKVHDNGAWCADCGTQSKENPLGRMGHIELALGWPAGFESFLATVLNIKSQKDENGKYFSKEQVFYDVCAGDADVFINGKPVRGLLELEKACKEINLDQVTSQLKEEIDFCDETILNDAGDEKTEGLFFENRLAALKGYLECVEAMQILGYTFADLFSHVLMVSPAEDRPLVEIGVEPLGKENKAYIEILKVNNETKAELEYNKGQSENEKNRLNEIVRNYVKVMRTSYADLTEVLTGDKSKDKKSLGEEFQKTRVANSTFAVAETSKNIPIDAVAIPYNILLFMYKDEVYKNLLNKTELRIQTAIQEKEILEKALADVSSDEALSADLTEQIEKCNQEEQKARADLADFKANAKAKIESQRFEGKSPEFESALLEIINAPAWQGEEVEVPGKVVLVGRFPVVSRNSIVALRPVLSEHNHCISVNPAVCERLGLDFDGDQLQVYRIRDPKAQEELWRNSSPRFQPFSATSGEILHANDREDALGVWIATRMDTPEECNFQRDAMLSGFIGNVKDGILETEGWVYARHILWSSGEGFVRTSPDNVVNPGDELGRDKAGNIIKAPWYGVLRKYGGSYKLLSIPQDRVHLPRGSKLNFDLTNNEKYTELDGVFMPQGTMLADWKVQEVDIDEVGRLYKEGKVDSNSAIYLKDAELTTTAGRLMVAQMLSAPDEGIKEDLLTQRIGKKQIRAAMQELCENVFQREDISLDEKANIVLQKQEDLLALGSQFAQFYSSYSDYDAFKYEYSRDSKGEIEKGKFQDNYYRFNSIKEQVESGAKGNQKQVNNFIQLLMGQDKILDAEKMAEAVYKLDKAGQADRNDGITPVQRTGSLQRILSESMYNLVIEQEDCGTDKYEQVNIWSGAPHSELTTNDIFSRISGRCLANEYVAGNGTVYARGKLLNKAEAMEVAEDVVAHNNEKIKKTVDIRTVSGCTCNGACAKCWGRSAGVPDLPKVGERIGLEAVMALTSGITEQGNLKAIANAGTESAGAAMQFQNILNGLTANGVDCVRGLQNTDSIQKEILRNLNHLVADSQLSVRDNYLELVAKNQVTVSYKIGDTRYEIGCGEFTRRKGELEEMYWTGKATNFTVHLIPYMQSAKETDRGRFALGGKQAVRNIKEAGLKNKAKKVQEV